MALSTSEMIREKILAVDFVEKTGSENPYVPTTIDNALIPTIDSALVYDADTENSRDDEAKSSFSREASCFGLSGGTATINGNLRSTTDGVTAPAIGKYLKAMAMDEVKLQLLEVSDATYLDVDATITGATSGNEANIVGIAGNVLAVALTSAEASYELETGDVITDSEANNVDVTKAYTLVEKCAFMYKPNTDSTTEGSVFFWRGDNVDVLEQSKGNISISFEYGGDAKFSMSFKGKTGLDKRGASTFPVLNFGESFCSKFVKNGLTMRYNDGTQDVVKTPSNTSIEYNYGATPNLLPDASDETGFVGTKITDRGDASATINLYKENYASFDAQSLKSKNTIFDTTYVHGAGVFNRSVFVRQKLKISSATSSAETGVMALSLECACVGNFDNDSYLIFW